MENAGFNIDIKMGDLSHHLYHRSCLSINLKLMAFITRMTNEVAGATKVPCVQTENQLSLFKRFSF